VGEPNRREERRAGEREKGRESRGRAWDGGVKGRGERPLSGARVGGRMIETYKRHCIYPFPVNIAKMQHLSSLSLFLSLLFSFF